MTVSLVGWGTESKGTTALTPSYPSSLSAGDLLVLSVANKIPSTPSAPSTPTGWTEQAQKTGGAGTDTVDSGQVTVTVYTKVATGSESGTLAVSVPSGDVAIAQIVAYRSTYGASTDWALQAASGAQTSDSNSWSVTLTTMNAAPGDVIVTIVGGNDNAAVMSWDGSDLTLTGATFNQPEPTGSNINSSLGNDILLAQGEIACATGPGTAAGTFTCTDTSATNSSGAVVLLRVRDGFTAVAAAHTYTLRVAINGSETDEDVEADSAPWTSKISKLKISGGGGGPVKQGRPFGCSFELAVPIDRSIYVRTITVAVEGPWTTTLKAWMTSDTTDRAYRVVYHGDVISAKAGLLQGTVEFDSLDEMYALGERRARLSAATGSDIKTLLQDIETAHSLTMLGADQFPDGSELFIDGATLMQIYRPAQKRTRNADFIANALAGTTVNMSCDWDGPITAPTMRWRPDHYYVGSGGLSTTRRQTLPMPRAQAFGFSDFGYAYNDHFARIDVAGASSTTDYYGWARLEFAADRNALGNRSAGLTGMWNTATRCEQAARTVLGQTVYPSFYHPFRIDASADHHYQTLSGWTGDTGESQEETGFHLAACMLGDQLRWLTTGSTGYESYSTALGAQKAADLATVFAPSFDGFSTTLADIRTITREWSPTGGWMLELGTYPSFIDPYVSGGGASDYGSGTD